MSEDKQGLFDFQSIVTDCQNNELAEEAKRFQEERRKANELRMAQNPNSINPTQLLGIRTEEELMLDLDEKLTKENQVAAKAAAEHEKEEENDVTVRFPAPTVTK